MPPPPPEEEKYNTKNVEFEMAITLLKEVKEEGYNRLRNQLLKIKWTQTSKFLSFYTFKKSWSKMHSLKLIPVSLGGNEMNNIDDGGVDDLFSGIFLNALLESFERSIESLLSSKIFGAYVDFVNMMLESYR